MSHPARRVRITHPRTDAARRVPARPVIHEIDEQTQLGEVYMASLVRSQRRLALLVCTLTAGVLAGTALLGALVPGFARVRVFGIAGPWLVLGVLIYPAMIGLAAYTVRHAERNERDFTQLVERR
ncbi:MAG TPA: hypothetical protein VGL21_13035 [Jatrophihabitantaceae bacterium]|jgi:hypothetical protein